MIEDSEIVKDIRKIRCAISEKVGNDPERYIAYLILKAQEGKTDCNRSPRLILTGTEAGPTKSQ
jgi:hypothetical protein